MLIISFKKRTHLILRTFSSDLLARDGFMKKYTLYLGVKGCIHTVSQKREVGANSKTAAFEIEAKRLLLTLQVSCEVGRRQRECCLLAAMCFSTGCKAARAGL